MAYTFADGEVATKAKLDLIIPGRLTQAGVTRVVPVASTPTSVQVTFATPFPSAPHVVATAHTTVIGSTVKGVSVTDVTTTGFKVWVYRTNTTGTYVSWQAFAPSTPFTTGEPAYASLLNQASGALVGQKGTASITPVANTPTSLAVTFGTAFAATPVVTACPVVTVPGSVVLGAAVTSVTKTGFTAWIYRTSTTATQVAWIALGRL